MTIEICEYQPTWPDEFRQIATRLRSEVGVLALRIDHIGSTSIPGLAAKDRIDIQVSVAALESPVQAAIEKAGFWRVERIAADHIPPGAPSQPEQWGKWIFKSPAQARAVNIHVRLVGRANQRYPLLFRDYLRTHPEAAQAYAQVKRALARLHPDDEEAYYDVKDPVCDLIMCGAEIWAAASGWRPPPSDA